MDRTKVDIGISYTTNKSLLDSSYSQRKGELMKHKHRMGRYSIARVPVLHIN